DRSSKSSAKAGRGRMLLFTGSNGLNGVNPLGRTDQYAACTRRPTGMELPGLFGSGTRVVLSLISTNTRFPQLPGPTASTVKSLNVPFAFVLGVAAIRHTKTRLPPLSKKPLTA